MRQNKVLGLAIATALSMSVSSSYAGDLQIYYGGYTDTEAPSGCKLFPGFPTYSSEYMFELPSPVPDGKDCGDVIEDFDGISPNDPLEGTPDFTLDDPHIYLQGKLDDRYIYAVYTPEEILSANFKATFELNNGATFGDNIDMSAGSGLDFVAHPSGSHAAATPQTGGDAFDSEVTFLVQPVKGLSDFSESKHTLVLRFTLADLEALQSAGEEIELTVTIFDSTGNTTYEAPINKVVAASMRSSAIELSAATGPVEIDVSTGSLNFVGGTTSVISETMVRLGNINIEYEQNAIQDDGRMYVPTPDSGVLTVINGNFAASVTEPGTVFLDFDGNGILDTEATPPDIIADSITSDTAIWELDGTEMGYFTHPDSADLIDIVIQADGVTPINDFSDAPEATLVINYSAKKDTFTKKLLHIKRNGTVCSLYNVPNPNAIDGINLRITNTSSKSGVLLGTLRLMDGTILFQNELLLAEGETIVPNQTIRLTQDDIDAINVAAGNESGWPGRAVLTVSSDVTSMEMFGLLRSKTGGPLTNMSVGGTGNSCD